jgi:hypothetical protein
MLDLNLSLGGSKSMVSSHRGVTCGSHALDRETRVALFSSMGEGLRGKGYEDKEVQVATH